MVGAKKRRLFCRFKKGSDKKKTHSKHTRPPAHTIAHHPHPPPLCANARGSSLLFIQQGGRTACGAYPFFFFFCTGVTRWPAPTSQHKNIKGRACQAGANKRLGRAQERTPASRIAPGRTHLPQLRKGRKKRFSRALFFPLPQTEKHFPPSGPPFFPPPAHPNLRPVLTRALSGAVVCTVPELQREREGGEKPTAFFLWAHVF